MLLPQYRWIPLVTELLQNIIQQRSSSAIYTPPAVKNVLNEYLGKFQNPTAPILTPAQPFPATKDRIFANNYVNLGKVDVVGFDLDYTLVSYTSELQTLIYTLAKDILVDAFGYPKELKPSYFDPKFAVRGLSVDARNGVLVKLSHLQRVGLKYSYKGKRPITSQELESFYGGIGHVAIDELTKLKPINDLFSLAEACLIADVIDIFEHMKSKTGEVYSAEAIIDDVQAAIRDVHISGAMHNAVIKDLDKYVFHTPHLVSLMEHLRKAGKKIFLCTNSGYKYTDEALSYMLGIPSLSKAKGPRTTDWRDLFDVVICSAQKPDFFRSRRPFRLWNAEGTQVAYTSVGSKLERGMVYAQGSASALVKAAGWEGQSVLYVGDNLRADLVEAKRCHGWHTACVINELDRELEVQSSPLFHELHFLRSTLRHCLTDLQLAMIQTEESTGPRIFNKEDEALIQVLETELRKINTELSCLFNPQFGSIFRTDGHPSLYAFAIRRYADVYMSEVYNMLNYSGNHRFFPSHALHMAHDPRN